MVIVSESIQVAKIDLGLVHSRILEAKLARYPAADLLADSLEDHIQQEGSSEGDSIAGVEVANSVVVGNLGAAANRAVRFDRKLGILEDFGLEQEVADHHRRKQHLGSWASTGFPVCLVRL